jgi:hypothetical protein
MSLHVAYGGTWTTDGGSLLVVVVAVQCLRRRALATSRGEMAKQNDKSSLKSRQSSIESSRLTVSERKDRHARPIGRALSPVP